MIESYSFIKSVLNTISEHIVVIDSEGYIVHVNDSWNSFGRKNRCSINDTWIGVNYLKECDKSVDIGDELGLKAAKGIRSVIETVNDNFYLEYPCHSPTEIRWFMMRVTHFINKKNNYFVIAHQNITERKLAEKEVLNLSRMDGLTNIANRRYYDEFLAIEWKRCKRLGLPISLAIIDLDHFKLLNDTYGHQAGDDCLKKIGKVLNTYVKRPSDLCARYGGEEFSIVLGNTDLKQTKVLFTKLLDSIRSLNIPNEKSPTFPMLTASIGVATMYPNNENNESYLIRESDESLYFAKKNGRNQIFYHENKQIIQEIKQRLYVVVSNKPTRSY